MSAAEKLKALDADEYAGNIVERADEYHRRGGFLLAALPQIVAVVEAAEKMKMNYRAEPDSEYRIRFWQSWDEFADALAALDEALT